MQRFVRRAQPPEAAPGQRLAVLTGLNHRMTALLQSRGILTDEAAQAYLHPALQHRHDPLLLHDMDRALALLADAKARRQRFIVYGDYDVDGICATAIMVQTLLQYGLQPPDALAPYYIPDRHEEGYGLNENAIRSLAGKTDLLVTVDCGITSVREVALAKALGMRVVITDHHTLPDACPDADAVIDPLMPPYPFQGLCGAGVAYQLCRALLGETAAGDCLDLAALATVADLVPLLDENRVLVSFGLKALEQTRRPGLKALIRAAGCRMPLTSEQIAFGLAPRLNACGRMESALLAVRLLFEQNEDQAERMAFEMNRLNEHRKDEERKVIADAGEQVRHMDLCQNQAIVVCGQGYDSGVVGLAAGRLAETYGYPTVVLAQNGDQAVGSARSVPGVNIYQALKACEDLFIRFGGHAQAAGMTLRLSDVAAFRARLSEAVSAQTGGRALMPTSLYDDTLDLSEVTAETVDLLRAMEPFGMGNPSPVFCLRGARLWAARAVGQDNSHLKCELRQGSVQRSGIAFRHGDLARLMPETVDILFTPVKNEFRGNVTYECQISRMVPAVTQWGVDETAEQTAMVMDLLAAVEQAPRNVPVQTETAPPAEIPEQGMLIFCRFADTARRWQKAHPALSVCTSGFEDPCAYTVISCGVPLGRIHAPYRRVVLADGDLTGMDLSLLDGGNPDVKGVTLPASDALRAAVKQNALSRDALAALFRLLRGHPGASLAMVASLAGMSIGQVLFAAGVFAHLRLMTIRLDTLEWSLAPHPEKQSLESDALYRLLQSRKGEM